MKRARVATCIGLVLLISLCAGGCSVYMAANQPERKNLDVLQKGRMRSEVLAEMGQPLATEIRDGQRVDVFSFKQGQDEAFNFGRAVGHGVADVLTLGIWEVAGTPTEMALKAKRISFEVTYDASDRVTQSVQIGRE